MWNKFIYYSFVVFFFSLLLLASTKKPHTTMSIHWVRNRLSVRFKIQCSTSRASNWSKWIQICIWLQCCFYFSFEIGRNCRDISCFVIVSFNAKRDSTNISSIIYFFLLELKVENYKQEFRRENISGRISFPVVNSLE